MTALTPVRTSLCQWSSPAARSGVVLAAAPGEVESLYADVARALNREERRRAEALRHQRDRAAFVAAHVLVRVAAARLIGVPAHELNVVQRCAACGGPHGRPSIAGAPEISVTLSHIRGYVAASAAEADVAVDVERPDPRIVDEAMLGQALTTPERHLVSRSPDPVTAATRLWVIKECLVKLGRVTLDELRCVDVGCFLAKLRCVDVGCFLASLVPEDGLESGPCHLAWPGLNLLEWRSEATGCLGMAVSTASLTLEVLSP